MYVTYIFHLSVAVRQFKILTS